MTSPAISANDLKLREEMLDLVASLLRQNNDVDVVLEEVEKRYPPELRSDFRAAMHKLRHSIAYGKLILNNPDAAKIHTMRWGPLMGELRSAAQNTVAAHPVNTFPHMQLVLDQLDALEKAVLEEFSAPDAT